MAERQKGLRFDRKENFANAELAMKHLADWCPPELRRRKGLARRLETLLKQIDLCSGASGCNALAETLASKCGTSRRNLQRMLKDAVALDLVEVQTSIAVVTGGQGANRLRVDWDRVGNLADRYRKRPAEDVRPVGQDGRALGHDGRPVGHHVRAYKKELIPPLIPKLSPPPPSPHEWRGVEEELIELGVLAAADAAAKARENGCSPEFVRSLIAHWRSKPGAWGPGALHARIRNAFPSQRPDEHWLKPSAAYLGRLRAAQERTAAAAPEFDAEAQRKAEHEAWLAERRAKGLKVTC